MMEYFRNRRVYKSAHGLLRHAGHVRNMREDVAAAALLQRMREAEQQLRATLKARDVEAVSKAADGLADACHKVAPPAPHPALRENLEVLVVAVSVAMGFRTYFVQPFKIPTGSMQPTLYGVHSRPHEKPEIMDRFPLKLAKWAVFGEWYAEKRALASGFLSQREPSQTDPSVCVHYIGGRRHILPRDAEIPFRPGDLVRKGDLLWAGVVTRGDHVFVDKVRWNFVRPRRGNVLVFGTDGIQDLPPGTHYIKRLSGLPGETLSIDPPRLRVNGNDVVSPRSILRVANREPGYAGYQLLRPGEPSAVPRALRTPDDRFELGAHEYYALGDNTRNSRDSRYWGAVPESNIVGPAFMVYWPVSSRWGFSP